MTHTTTSVGNRSGVAILDHALLRAGKERLVSAKKAQRGILRFASRPDYSLAISTGDTAIGSELAFQILHLMLIRELKMARLILWLR